MLCNFHLLDSPCQGVGSQSCTFFTNMVAGVGLCSNSLPAIRRALHRRQYYFQTQEIWAILRNPIESWLCFLAKWGRESIVAVNDCSRKLGKGMCHGIGKTIGLRDYEPAEASEGPRVVRHTADNHKQIQITAKMRRQTFTQP